MRPSAAPGLGKALLQHGFREYARRGAARVGLKVDATNPTGAPQLYERVGFVTDQPLRDLAEAAVTTNAATVSLLRWLRRQLREPTPDRERLEAAIANNDPKEARRIVARVHVLRRAAPPRRVDARRLGARELDATARAADDLQAPGLAGGEELVRVDLVEPAEEVRLGILPRSRRRRPRGRRRAARRRSSPPRSSAAIRSSTADPSAYPLPTGGSVLPGR